MEQNDLIFIQEQIGYPFNNPDLLQQAFTRRSYAEENGGEHNEVLEFIGDKVLDFVVVKLLTQHYGWLHSQEKDFDPNEDWDEFACEMSEAELTALKAQLVCKKSLSEKIDGLGFAEYLIMGNGDIRKHVEQSASVKEDLFEAIIGAVAIDCSYDMEKIESVVELMLDTQAIFDDEAAENYVATIQQWTQSNYHQLPDYKYIDQRKEYFQTISNQNPYARYRCELQLGEKKRAYKGWGESKAEARWDACRNAYDALWEEGWFSAIYDEIENPNYAEAISQLEILARRGYFSIPTYDFSQTYDKNGNPVWKSTCRIAEEERSFSAKSSSKKDAKKTAAFKMLRYVLDIEEKIGR
ncbi:MAG: ribonuclease III family protein [Oscillospiraceae bacterium]|nr:ribonuclease III family protein [Oscillospiraceae bacterium]